MHAIWTEFRIPAWLLVAICTIGAPFSLTFAETNVPQVVTVRTTDGKVVCNTSAAFSQVPGHTDLFVGRGFGIGTLDDCHKLHQSMGFLAMYRMDWNTHELVMQYKLVGLPVKTPTGVDLRTAYDPYVAAYKGSIWVAFECAVPGAVSSCIAPLNADLKSLDVSRLSVPALGVIGPHGPNHQLVCLLSASAPTLLSSDGNLFLYWQVDPFDNQAAKNVAITRGMQLEQDSRGLLWGKGSAGRPVSAVDQQLSSLVHDVDSSDQTKDHVAVTSDLVVVDHKIMEIASIGGTAGREICRSTHDESPGCWRTSLSIADNPLGPNVFGKHVLRAAALPSNIIEYPRLIVDPSGHHFLFGNFLRPKAAPVANRTLPISEGVEYIPFEPKNYLE